VRAKERGGEMNTLFKVGETYKTRGGWDALVLSIDGFDNEPVVAKHFDNCKVVECHHEDGTYLTGVVSGYDLIPPVQEVFEVLWPNGDFYVYCDKEKESIKMANNIGGKVIRYRAVGDVEL